MTMKQVVAMVRDLKVRHISGLTLDIRIPSLRPTAEMIITVEKGAQKPKHNKLWHLPIYWISSLIRPPN